MKSNFSSKCQGSPEFMVVNDRFGRDHSSVGLKDSTIFQVSNACRSIPIT